MTEYPGGAKRCDVKPPYNLINRKFLAGMAEVLRVGAEKYGTHNWRKGGKEFAVDAVNHIIEHIYMFVEGDRSEQHLLHAAVGLMFVEHFNRQHPEWYLEEIPGDAKPVPPYPVYTVDGITWIMDGCFTSASASEPLPKATQPPSESK